MRSGFRVQRFQQSSGSLLDGHQITYLGLGDEHPFPFTEYTSNIAGLYVPHKASQVSNWNVLTEEFDRDDLFISFGWVGPGPDDYSEHKRYTHDVFMGLLRLNTPLGAWPGPK